MWRYTHEPKYREWAWEAAQVSRMKDVAEDRKIKIIKNNVKKKMKKKRFASACFWLVYGLSTRRILPYRIIIQKTIRNPTRKKHLALAI